MPSTAVERANWPTPKRAWETIPNWYLVGTRDNVIPAAQQRIMGERASAQTVEVKASHMSVLSRPGAVDLIATAARAVHPERGAPHGHRPHSRRLRPRPLAARYVLGRHSLALDGRWREVADTALTRLKEESL